MVADEPVELVGLSAERHLGLDGGGGVHRQRQVLLHQRCIRNTLAL